MEIKCTNIQYMLDDEDDKIDLPSELILVVNDDLYEMFNEEPNDVEDELGDLIEEYTGHCVSSFEFEEIK